VKIQERFSGTMQIDYLADHPHAITTLARWHHEQWKHLNPGTSIEQRIARLHTHLGKGQIPMTFVALCPSEVRCSQPGIPVTEREIFVGSASLIAQDMDTRPDLSPWLASVFVAPEYRRKGIGTALVRRVIQEAARLDTTRLYLFTTPDKQRFYARLGWSLIEHTRYRGYQQIVMVLEIDRSR
jgi:GNAT superfamily N-acetyltransferase